MGLPRTRELAAVLDLVRTGRASTRGEIVSHLNLRSTSVSDYVGELVAKELLRESIVKRQGRGRPAATLVYNLQRFGAIFIQVTSRSIAAKAVDMAGNVIAERTAEPPHNTNNADMAATLLRLARAIKAKFPKGVEVVAIICSLSGLLDAPRHLWCFTSRWPEVRNLDIAAALAPLGHTVTLVRNLDAELIGRLASASPAQSRESVLLLHWGYGIGAAYYTEGAIVNRTQGRFCEIGHWRLGSARGRTCTCGNTDCLETIAALWSLGPKLREAFAGMPATEAELRPVARDLDLLSVPEMEAATSEVVRLTANLARLLFPYRIILTGPFVHNAAIFNRFVEELERAPVLKTLDHITVGEGDAVERHELDGALAGVFEKARATLLAAGTG
ncbi:ROK family protein [Acuticoccus sp. MNP-M23]|uniref:ROK family protein n=1 Tax=Acuticoccus sp. MNP-M23 TaxID=3072793 RepID=UPI0028153ED2|nr:ROK family protein [Acuticoccus sp. MNP-M23]WMS42650.1 ROK family protein [Acuticoccus sp. MNP-M23]